MLPVPRVAARRLWQSVARFGTFGLALLAAGCSSKHAGQAPRAYAPSDLSRPAIEMEADGMPVQLALRDRNPEPDDPSEPWSPNYGKALNR